MPNMSVTPTTQKPGKTVAVDFWCSLLDPDGEPAKVMLTTVDANGVESGFDYAGGGKKSTNINRPLPDGSLRVGIKAPPTVGLNKVRAYQFDQVVAEAALTVRR